MVEILQISRPLSRKVSIWNKAISIQYSSFHFFSRLIFFCFTFSLNYLKMKYNFLYSTASEKYLPIFAPSDHCVCVHEKSSKYWERLYIFEPPSYFTRARGIYILRNKIVSSSLKQFLQVKQKQLRFRNVFDERTRLVFEDDVEKHFPKDIWRVFHFLFSLKTGHI